MRTRNYMSTIWVLCAAMLVLILILSFLLYNQGPRVRIVDFERDPQTTSSQLGSTVSLIFDRPLQDQDYSELISFSPSVDFRAQTSSQTIFLTFQQNLLSDTEYKIIVQPELYDSSGIKMKSKYEHTFSTGSASYVYVERNYEDRDITDADDHVIRAVVGQEPETLFSAQQISFMDANKDYVIVVVRGELTDVLYSIDQRTGEATQQNLQINGRINQLAISPTSPVALYTLLPNFDSVSQEFFESYVNKLESINLETGEITGLTDLEGEYLRAVSIDMDTSGQVALIQNDDQEFYAISPFNDYDPILIGSRTATFGFNEGSSEILFREQESFLSYDVASGEVSPLGLPDNTLVRDLLDTNSGLYISSTIYVGGEPNSTIELTQDFTREPDVLWQNTNHPLSIAREFSLSFDKKLIAIQLEPEGCRFDRITTNSQCQNVSTILHDVSTGNEIAEFRGFGLVWLP